MNSIPNYEIVKLTKQEVIMKHRGTRMQYLYVDPQPNFT